MRTIRITGEEYVKRLVAPFDYDPAAVSPWFEEDDHYTVCRVCEFVFDDAPIGRVNGKNITIRNDARYCPICGSQFEREHYDDVLEYEGLIDLKEMELTDSALEIMVGSRMFREMFGESE